MEHKNIVISLDPYYLTDKNHNLSALVAAYQSTFVKEDGEITVDNKFFRAKLANDYGFSKYKRKIIIESFLHDDVLQYDENGDYTLGLLKTPFIKLDAEMAEFCAKTLSNGEFKVYCFLLHKYKMNRKYEFKEHYYFSKKELVQQIGYSVSQKNIEKMKCALKKLTNLDLIQYNENAVLRPGKKGSYHALLFVTDQVPHKD